MEYPIQVIAGALNTGMSLWYVECCNRVIRSADDAYVQCCIALIVEWYVERWEFLIGQLLGLF